MSVGFIVRCAVGGVLMGLANLVPGISGGTMLLAVGVYPMFIAAIADISMLRFKRNAVLPLVAVIGSAAVAILLLAGVVKAWVIDYRWLMYSLFIGLTLGGVPLVWRLARPVTPVVWVGAAAGLGLMLLMSMSFGGSHNVAGASSLLLLLAGVAGASAMILPGVSGAYLLLLLGQYEVILDAIERCKFGLVGNPATGADPDLMLVVASFDVIIPVAVGVIAGVVGVSNLLKWLLLRFAKPTFGVLIGLLFGATIGLWPFQHIVSQQASSSAELESVIFVPTFTQSLSALILIAIGLAITQLIDRIGRNGAPAAD